jgi:5-hydroxyisourate hydrolase-like protein (transthyretin family)
MRRFVCLLFPLVMFGQQPPAAAPQAGGPPQPGQNRQGRQRQGTPDDQAAAAPLPATKPEDLCTVDGQISSVGTGGPLKKVTVTLRATEVPQGRGGGLRGYAATTDASGRFTITGVEPGKYRLTAARTGYVDTEYGSKDYLRTGSVLTLAAKQHLGNLNFNMAPNAVIAGRVLDEDRDPMASVQVQALRYRYTQGKKQLVAYADDTTNDIGEYRLSGLPAGRYFISVAPRNNSMRGGFGRTIVQQQQPEEEYVRTFYPAAIDSGAAAPVDVEAGAQRGGVDFALSRRHIVTLKGHVSDASGLTAEARRIMVVLTPRDPAAGPSMGRPTTIDRNGNFEIRGVTPGSYNLVAAVPSREVTAAARMQVDVGNRSVDNLNITINPPLTVAGRIRIEGQTDTTAVPNVQVSLRSREGGNRMFGSNAAGKVAADGTFTLANVNPDQYTLTLSGLPDGYYIKSIRAGEQDALTPGLDLSRGAAGAIDVILSPNAGQVTGIVQNGQQQPAPGAAVVLVPLEAERSTQPQYYKTATTDDTGRFTVKTLDPGQYRVYAWQEVESGAYMDPDFIKPVENSGQTVTIRESSQETVQVKLIS